MTTSSGRHMKLAVFINNTGAHISGWRHPGVGEGNLHDIGFYRQIAETAERGLFDAFFVGDGQGHRHIEGRDAFAASDNAGKLEPLTMLAALAMVTRHIALIATASTTYNEPYALARRFLSLDHISGGRAGWNVVTSTLASEARNFGFDRNMEHDRRYERADEFLGVVNRLWDSWEEGALLLDRAGGRYFDPAKVHALEHRGEFLASAGPLNVCRSPQGRPLIVQAGASPPGRALAARTADLVFTAQPSLEGAQAFYADMKARAIAEARDPATMLVIPSMQMLVRSTEAEARAAERELAELIPEPLAISTLQRLLGGFDLSPYPLDGPLPDIPVANGSRSVQRQLVRMAHEQEMSILALARHAAVSRSAMPFAGTPEQVADLLQTWFEGRAADGFSITPHYLPGGLTEFVDHVVPILRERGLMRDHYPDNNTARALFGLEKPENMFVAHPKLSHEPRIWAPVAQQAGDE